MNFFTICSYKQLFSGFCWWLWGFTVIDINGRVYVVSDLQGRLVVPSRDQLIVDTLTRYFTGDGLPGR
jgi:hypothetical protein